MAQIYIVTEGSYSDYHIVGVFSTEEKAKAVAAGDYAMVETYEVDELVGKTFVSRHEVVIRLEDGEVTEEHQAYESYKELAPPNVAETTWLKGSDGSFSRYTRVAEGIASAEGAMVRSPISLDHARKVAAEKRQEWLRLKAGV